MEYLSLLLADRMIKCQVIEEDDKKYYAYSIQLLLEKITGILLISGFALIFKSFAEIILFLITFSLIRIHSAYSGAAEPPVRCGVSHVSGPDGATLLELM